MQNYRLLGIDIPPLKEGFRLPVGTKPQTFYSLKVEDVFNPELIEFFSQFGFIPQYALIFHHQPFVDTQPIHKDNVGDVFRCSINWIFCKEYAMRWYKPKDETLIIPGVTSPQYGENNAVNVPFSILAADNAELIEETKDKGPILVNIGNVFHNAVNLGDEDRWSVILKFTKDSTPTWEYCIDKLKSWIIEQR